MTHHEHDRQSAAVRQKPRFDVHHPEWNSNFFWRLLNACNAAVVVINRAYELVYCNEYAAEVMLGYGVDELVGRSLAQFRTLPDEEMEVVAASMTQVFDQGLPSDVENWVICKDGSRRRVFWSSMPLFDGNGVVTHLVGVGWDVTRQRDVETRLKSLAHFDDLTGLYNRSSFMELLRAELHDRPAERGMTLMYLDLDGFKAVNDDKGHDVGDELLREVAVRLRHTLRQSDVVARLGGDEFAVFLRDAPSRPDAAMLAEKLLNSLCLPFEHAGATLAVGASIGIALFPHDGIDAETLLQRADAAMYRAKRAGKNCFRFCDDSDSAIIV